MTQARWLATPTMSRPPARLRAAWAAAALVVCTVAGAQTAISGLSTNPDGGNQSDPLAVTACNGAAQIGTLYRHSESEPHLAVNPAIPGNMIAGWHQDRWSNGAAQSLGAAYTQDAGKTWQRVIIPFTRCSGGMPGSTGDYERGSDPWISFSPDGTAHYMALVANRVVNENAMTVARSLDGGQTWSAPIVIARNPAQDPNGRSLFHDKNTITADPHDSNYVYATWTLFRTGFVSLVFARSVDGGRSWSPAKPIATMGPVDRSERTVFRQGAQVLVLHDGTLVNVFYRSLFDSATSASRTEQVVLRSTDRGAHWTRVDTPIAPFVPATGFDVERGIAVRDAGPLPSAAVNRSTGQLYVAWQGRGPETPARVGVFVARSDDGGKTWSAPTRVNAPPWNQFQAFLPAVAVNKDGLVGVLFYDFRNDVPGDDVLSTDVHLAVFDASLNLISERLLTSRSFDMRQLALTDRGYFPGDYVGLSADGSDFVAAFARGNDLGLEVVPPATQMLVVNTDNRQDIVFIRRAP